MKKRCRKCDQEKNLSEFRADKERLDGRRYSCKECDRAFYRSRYNVKYGETSRRLSKERTTANRLFLQEFKANLGCTFCSEREAICLEFHHLDPTQKDFGMASNLNRNREQIMNEVSKCAVLCSNCHKKVHAKILFIPE